MQTLTWLLIVIIIIIHLALFSENHQSNAQYDNKVIKTKNSEHFVLPFGATNSDRLHPLVYTYASTKSYQLDFDNTE